jgi:hypothetical protein
MLITQLFQFVAYLNDKQGKKKKKKKKNIVRSRKPMN